MTKQMTLKIIFILSIIFLENNFSQTDKLIHNFRSNTKSESINIIISEIEESIKQSDVLKLSQFINAQTYFSLMGNINGYYTTNQAFYILEDFFKINKIQLFKFNQVNNEENNPYATGTLYYESKGRKNKAQVFVTLKRVGESWIISQLSIN
ncbi:MAG: DUF4783 domain-containing protein [Ignavibacterium sp.]|nr:DUF4783 domain-containing protein [Ignavibacterium sp.]MDW8375781.1 DUF4783 domain-containing protein [Ignavibacteriales bacterium]